MSRALPIRVGEYTAWCMEPTDLVLSKLGAGREKDFDFARSAATLYLVTEAGLLERLQLVTATPVMLELIANRIHALFRSPPKPTA